MYYYQQINNIGKEVAMHSSTSEINDEAHYRAVSKEYYEAVVALLHERAVQNAVEE